MVEFNEDLPEKRRVIRFPDDEESQSNQIPLAQRSQRRNSTSSATSVYSIERLRQRAIDPALVLPIEYRTLSLHIEHTTREKEKEITPKPTVSSKSNAKESRKDDTATEFAARDWHKVAPAEIYARLGTHPDNGLDAAQVKAAFAKYGRNAPSPPPSQLGRKLFSYFFGGFGSLLLTGSILVFISWKPLGQPPSQANLALAIVLLAVFFIQAAFNGWQDFSSSRVMDSITGMLPESCMVIREGSQTQIPAAEVVPGDLLRIKAGVKLPADVRLVQVSSDAKFDRSILTGESLPISGSTDSTDDNYLETKCIGMQGTHCTSGTCLGVVVSTGNETVFGTIAKLASAPKTGMTTLQKEILRFVLIICSLAFTFIIVVIAVWAGYLRPQHPDYINVSNLIVAIVSVGIAFVPEGLPIALTAGLTIVANIMKQNNVLCKSLKTVETLGAVSVICSDKTGTLTKNKMTVTHCAIGTDRLTTREAEDQIDAGSAGRKSALQQLQGLAALCNAGEFDASTLGAPLAERLIQGDATDQAVLRFSEGLAASAETRRQWSKEFELAFNSKNKYMIRVFSADDTRAANNVVTREEDTQMDLLFTIKGAPDVLLPRCDRYVTSEGSIAPLDKDTVKQIEDIKDTWSASGKRVILLARRVLRDEDLKHEMSDGAFEEDAVELGSSSLVLVGLVALVDPPRDEIPSVVAKLRRAGIRVFMVTGDFRLTAQAISRECGIITVDDKDVDTIAALSSRSPSVTSITKRPDTKASSETGRMRAIALSGSDLALMDDSQWSALCYYDEIVFARTTPEQKLRIVQEFQKHDNLVAMTGDGVNDAPSLKAADIGISLGTGSDIAIEASDMILLDSFGGVVEAVLYGRIVFDNLRKVICYLLPAGSFSEFWPVLTSIIFGLPQILSSFLMIIICCCTDAAVAITISYEKPEADVMLRPPRRKNERLVDWRLLLHSYIVIGGIECVTSFAMSYWHCQRNGVPFSALWFGFSTFPGLDAAHAMNVLNEASSIYFVNLVIMQWFNIMATRTRRLSIFQHPPLFNKATQNVYLFPAILFSLVIIFIFCYVPGLQRSIGSTQVPVEYFFFPVAWGMAILLLDETRKYFVRRYPAGFLARIAW